MVKDITGVQTSRSARTVTACVVQNCTARTATGCVVQNCSEFTKTKWAALDRRLV